MGAKVGEAVLYQLVLTQYMQQLHVPPNLVQMLGMQFNSAAECDGHWPPCL